MTQTLTEHPTRTTGTGRAYHLISSDSHINEPPDLFTPRVPAALRDRAPRMERFEQGDAWVFEHTPAPLPFGLNACAGQDTSLRQAWVRFEDIRRGGWDPKARLEEIDRARVDAEVLYPTPRISHGLFSTEDPELHVALIRAYNDWLAEYAEHDVSRFRALPILPNRGHAHALAEIERVAERPSTGGFMTGAFFGGTLSPEPEDDLVFAALAERDLPLHVHVSLNLAVPVPAAPGGWSLPAGTGSRRFAGAAEPLTEMILSGVFDRVPGLKMVFAEVDCGWVPYFKEQADDGFSRYRFKYDVKRFPSEYVQDHAWFTYVTDGYGIANRHLIGVDKILWSSDYPHGNSNYPEVWAPVQASMAGVPQEERHAILAGNAMDLYKFGGSR